MPAEYYFRDFDCGRFDSKTCSWDRSQFYWRSDVLPHCGPGTALKVERSVLHDDGIWDLDVFIEDKEAPPSRRHNSLGGRDVSETVTLFDGFDHMTAPVLKLELLRSSCRLSSEVPKLEHLFLRVSVVTLAHTTPDP